ncbi:MAG TPA: phospholipase D-like domain-containing protein [Acidimicrobiia bacterium]|nr:phospholipase D-like domain-containing protein [Acidimicrobiia bacterium]
MTDSPVELDFLQDGGQSAGSVLARLLTVIQRATTTLDLAIYDAHLADADGTTLLDALHAAEARGVRVRAVYNDDSRPHNGPHTSSPPPDEASLLTRLAHAVPAKAIDGIPDLMHHKYVVRDGAEVLTGSTNWTTDAFTRQENVMIIIQSNDLAAAYTEDFEQLWNGGIVVGTGAFDDLPAPITLGREQGSVRALFSPGRGPGISQLIATRLGQASTRIRVCSPVVTASPVLATLAELIDDRRCEIVVTVDGPMMAQAVRQWTVDGRAKWKVPLWERIVAGGVVAQKASTPYAPGAVHDYMHAKLVVCDDVLITGSYNCSHSGEMNAENVVEIHGAELADQGARYAEAVHARYAATPPPPTGRHQYRQTTG